jgi:hypothetical protein
MVSVFKFSNNVPDSQNGDQEGAGKQGDGPDNPGIEI